MHGLAQGALKAGRRPRPKDIEAFLAASPRRRLQQRGDDSAWNSLRPMPAPTRPPCLRPLNAHTILENTNTASKSSSSSSKSQGANKQ